MNMVTWPWSLTGHDARMYICNQITGARDTELRLLHDRKPQD